MKPGTALPPQFAALALGNVVREFPNKLDHVMNSADDVKSPRALHPVFYGSYDWHSAVHMHWLLARLLRLDPALSEADRIHAVFDAHFSAANVAAEVNYLAQPSRATFERTYGWAWLLKLQAELSMAAESLPRAKVWADALEPLADAFIDRYLAFLPLAKFPIRAGTHANSAFGLLFALDYAERMQHLALRKLIFAKAHAWYGQDARYPAAYEPGADDFLSGGLMEAALMMRCIDGCSYADWWAVFCPAPHELQTWLEPVPVSDRSDARLSHLDGLNLSRAWCWRLLKRELPEEFQSMADSAISRHLEASLPHASAGHYVGTHWLASFAALALTES
jgi:Protein of unknown function (DUF2891)